MSKMQELYEKVSADSTLQAKFAEIMKDAGVAGEVATKEKLIAFAKEMGYAVTVDEMQEFFKELAGSKKGGLSDLELDQVAGGKSAGGVINIVSSVLATFGCGLASAALEVMQDNLCGDFFA